MCVVVFYKQDVPKVNVLYAFTCSILIFNVSLSNIQLNLVMYVKQIIRTFCSIPNIFFINICFTYFLQLCFPTVYI